MDSSYINKNPSLKMLIEGLMNFFNNSNGITNTMKDKVQKVIASQDNIYITNLENGLGNQKIPNERKNITKITTKPIRTENKNIIHKDEKTFGGREDI